MPSISDKPAWGNGHSERYAFREIGDARKIRYRALGARIDLGALFNRFVALMISEESLLSRRHVPQVTDRGLIVSPLAVVGILRNGYRGQDSQDRKHNRKLDKCEAV